MFAKELLVIFNVRSGFVLHYGDQTWTCICSLLVNCKQRHISEVDVCT
jgi:hypothetical protein